MSSSWALATKNVNNSTPSLVVASGCPSVPRTAPHPCTLNVSPPDTPPPTASPQDTSSTLHMPAGAWPAVHSGYHPLREPTSAKVFPFTWTDPGQSLPERRCFVGPGLAALMGWVLLGPLPQPLPLLSYHTFLNTDCCWHSADPSWRLGTGLPVGVMETFWNQMVVMVA